ncbi:MAG: 50S ribosomal protein L10, partial [Nanoarchaeota archaeon]|nr:50S ribosomal protein L10 [Nanoarchaeota archaeon]
MKAHVSEKKKNEVKILKDLFKKYRVISIGDLTSLPSKQLQEIRRKLKDSLLIKVTKKRLIKRAISEFKDKDLSKLNDYLNCMPVLLFTNDDPFKLYRLLKKSKSKAPIKAGQIAPNDLIVKAGPTNFAPGPIIGELGQVGIIAGVEDGKIAIKKEKIVVKEGEEVSPKVANILAKLGEEPMEIGLNLKVAYEEGILYGKD